MKTLREIAEAAHVTKPAVRKKASALGLLETFEKNENGVVIVPDSVADTLVSAFVKVSDTVTETQEIPAETEETKVETVSESPLEKSISILETTVETLREQLAAKDRQIEAQQNTIDTLTAALSAAQALHAGSIQIFQQIAQEAEDQTAEAVHVVDPVEENERETAPEQPKRRSFFGFWRR